MTKGPAEANEFDCPISAEEFVGRPVAFADLLGRSLLEHVVERFVAAGVRTVAIVVQWGALAAVPTFRSRLKNLSVNVTDEPWAAVRSILSGYTQQGLSKAFVVEPSTYAEADLIDLLAFHSGGYKAVTRACDSDGPLELWVVDCKVDASGTTGTKPQLFDLESYTSSYFVREYVRRITEPRDFRILVVDALHSRCNLHPMGEQLKPWIWIDEGAQVRRGARLVGPAYLGRQCVIGECALITRGSNVESNCYIDYGTAIEDSSVLSDSYVGMWLDVSHSVVNASKLVNLERGVLVEVDDSSLLDLKGSSPTRKDRTGMRGQTESLQAR